MKGGPLTWALAAVSVLACGSLEPRSAAAQMLKCESHALAVDDEASLRARARAVLPSRARIESVGACRNPNNAIGWILTRKTITSEGVSQWWELLCRRDVHVWKCDAPEFKQFVKLALVVDGQSREIELNFDRDSQLERSRSLAAKALDIYVDLAIRLPGCEVKKPSVSDFFDVHRGNRLPTGNAAIHVSVAHAGDGDSVTLDDVYVAIGFPLGPDEAARTTAVCWNDEIVVT
jgi:hypothetical protein